MKKLLTLIILTLTLIGSFTFNVFAINVDYSFNITDNKKWNLNTGLIENDLKYSITSKMIVGAERIYTQSQTYHHVLFWNKYNEFIGYKNTQYSIYENDKYISNIEYGNSGFDAPETAKYYSFMIYKSGNSVVYDELNGQTLNDIFNNYDNTNLGDKENPILDNYTINEFAETQLTGKNLFDKDNPNIVNDKSLGSTGGEFNVSGYSISHYIEVQPSTNYVRDTSAETRRIVYYDENYNILTVSTAATLISPSNAKYARFSFFTASITTQFEQGSTATPYEPHDTFLTKNTFAEFETIPNVNYVETDNNRLRYVMNEDEITSNNQPLYELNGQTLNDVFNTGNLITNGDFSNGTTSWTVRNITTPTTTDGVVSFTALTQYGRLTYNAFNLTNTNKYYILSKIKADSSSVRLLSYNGSTDVGVYHSGSGEFEVLSHIITATQTTTNDFVIQVIDYRTSGWTPIQVDYAYAYNLTDLGIDSLTQSQLDEYFEIYKYFDNGGTDPQTFTYENPIYYDITYRLDTYFNGLDLTPQQFVYYQEGYHRILNNEQANDFIIYYAGQYAKSNNSNLGYTDEQWEQYYYNYLLFDDANTPYLEELNYYSLNEVFGSPAFEYNYTSSSDKLNWYDDNTATETYDYNNGIYISSSNRTTTFYAYTDEILDNSKYYYLITSVKVLQETEYFRIGFSQNTNERKYIYNPTPNIYITYTLKGNPVIGRVDYVADISALGDTIHMDYYKIIDITALGIDHFTQAQLDNYYNDYINNQMLEQNLYLLALQTTSFNIIQPYYDYTEPAPDDFLDVDSETFLDNLLTDIGFNNDLGRIGLSLVVLFFTALTLIKLNMPNSVIISVEILTFVGLSFLGWLPAWINIVIALGIIILLYLRFSGNGGGSNEESD